MFASRSQFIFVDSFLPTEMAMNGATTCLLVTHQFLLDPHINGAVLDHLNCRDTICAES